MPKNAAALLMVLTVFVSACGLPAALRGGRETARRIAAEHGLQPLVFETAPFVLTGYARSGPGRDLVVYLEGDGHAYLDRRRPAGDPTPRDPTALRLAAADPAPKILYLARPCQYTRPEAADGCHPRFWTLQRYSEPVVAAIDKALDDARRRLSADRLHLVGWSGGGTLAMLAAVRRTDVASVLTVAGNLDHAAWTAHHGVAPLSGSRNAADHAIEVARIPQVHLAGSEDRVVPPAVVRAFMARLPADNAATLVVLPGIGHRKGWAQRWAALLQHYRPVPVGGDSAADPQP